MNDAWRELQARNDRVFAKLREQPPVVIDLLVAASGCGLSRSRGEEDWSLSCSSPAWRPEGGELRQLTLHLRQRASREALRDWQSFLAADGLVRVRARLLEDNEMGIPQAWLEEGLGESSDPELAVFLAELQKPIVVDEPQLGRLTWDRGIHWFQGMVQWCGRDVRLNVSAETPDEAKPGFEVARRLLADSEAWRVRVEDYAVAKLLELKNDNWLGDDEAPFDAESFKARMTLTSIGVEPDGHFSFWHDDGDLFWGHSIMVSGDLESGPTDADIPG